MPISTITANSVANNSLTTDQFVSTAVHGQRNLIINGAMQVAQRGTSHSQSPNSGGYHTVDRFSYRRTGTWSGVTAVALSQQSSGAPSGFTHFLRYAPTGSDSSTPSDTSMYIDAKLEGNSISLLALGTSAAKSFTLSFYVRSSVTGTFSVALQNNEPTKDSYVAEYTIDSANTWERKQIAVNAPTSGTFATGTSAGLALYFIVSADASSSVNGTSTIGSWLSATDARWSSNQSDGVTTSPNQTFDITGVQLEVGDTATPFEHRSYGEELALCERYYQTGSTGWLIAVGNGEADNGMPLRTIMRATPAFSMFNISNASLSATRVGADRVGWNGSANNGGYGNYYFDYYVDAEL